MPFLTPSIVEFQPQCDTKRKSTHRTVRHDLLLGAPPDHHARAGDAGLDIVEPHLALGAGGEVRPHHPKERNWRRTGVGRRL